MTEDNPDSKTPKLRLSRQAAEDAPKKAPEATPKPKEDIQFGRPVEDSIVDADITKEDSTLIQDSPIKSPEESAAKEADFDPKNPFEGVVEEPKVKNGDRSPPELSGKPAPRPNDGSAEKLEEAISQVGAAETSEEERKGGLLTSIAIIVVLLAILGGAGYGLYYVLKGPAEASDSASVGDTTQESGGLLTGPIDKAKAAIETKTDKATVAAEDAGLTDSLAASGPTADNAAVDDVKANLEAASREAGTSITQFLQSAHIGGMRTGDRPMLIMNGETYYKGDLINPDNGLRFIGFRDEKLAFRDDKGIIYIKSF